MFRDLLGNLPAFADGKILVLLVFFILFLLLAGRGWALDKGKAAQYGRMPLDESENQTSGENVNGKA